MILCVSVILSFFIRKQNNFILVDCRNRRSWGRTGRRRRAMCQCWWVRQHFDWYSETEISLKRTPSEPKKCPLYESFRPIKITHKEALTRKIQIWGKFFVRFIESVSFIVPVGTQLCYDVVDSSFVADRIRRICNVVATSQIDRKWRINFDESTTS